MASFDGFLVSLPAPSFSDALSSDAPIVDGFLVPTQAFSSSDSAFFLPLEAPPAYVPPTSVQPLVKIWQFDVNQVFSSTDGPTVRKELLFRIKESLIGFARSPWVVVGSSDSVTAGMDGVDRWLTPANIVNGSGGSPQSWIVLEQPGLGGMQLQLGVAWGPDIAVGRVRVSQTGAYVGSSITAQPTAADEKNILPSQQYFGNYSISPSVGADVVLHVMQSTDGKCTRIVSINTRDQKVGCFAMFDEVVDPTPGWSPAILSGWDGLYSNHELNYAGRYDTSTQMFGEHAGTQMEFRMTSMGVGSNPMGKVLPGRSVDDNDDWPIMGIGLVSFTAGKTGRHGRLVDLFFGMDNAPDRMIYDAELGAKQTLAQLGDMVFPWPVGIPVMM